jgi:uncharacterized Rmd1/YagE family protein
MSEAAPLVAHALLLAERLDTRGLDRRGPQLPGVLALGGVAGGGSAFAFRWGALVTIGAPLEQARALGAQLCRHLADAVAAPAHETALIRIGPAAAGTEEDGVDEAGMVRLRDGSQPRLALVAEALAKSAALAHQEAMLARTLDRLEPPLERLRRGRLALPARVLVPLIGEAIAARAHAAARVDTAAKPDLLWEHPNLTPLYAALAAEWELDERTDALGRKLEMVREMSETLLALAEARRSRMLELAVAALIATEVATTLYGLVAG